MVLSFRSPIKARGSNYMYGADGSTVGSISAFTKKERIALIAAFEVSESGKSKQRLKIRHDKTSDPLARLRSSHTWAGHSRVITEATGPARLFRQL